MVVGCLDASAVLYDLEFDLSFPLSTAEQNWSKRRRKISPLDVMPNAALRVIPVATPLNP